MFGNGYVPYALWGGSTGYAGNPGGFPGSYNSVANVPSPMTISLSLSIDGNTLSATAVTELLENITSTNNRILFILTHNFDKTQPGNYFASVVRFQEQNFNETNAGDTQVYTQSFDIAPTWSHDDLRLVAFVQTFSGNRIIHQAAMTDLSDPQPPVPFLGAPQNLAGSFNESTLAVDLAWSVPNYAHTTHLGYKIFRNDNLIHEVGTSVTTYTDTDVELDEVYSYYTTAMYSDGESAPSNVFEVATVFQPVFGIPQNLTGIFDESAICIDLSWEAPTYAHTTFLGYQLYRNNEHLKEVDASILSFTDETIELYSVYTYYMIALYSDGESAHSNYVTVPTGNAPVIAPPKNLSGVFAHDWLTGRYYIELEWETPDYANTTLVGYNVYLNGEFLVQQGLSLSIQYIEDEFNFGEPYTFYVTALYTDAESEPSDSVIITPVSENETPVQPTLSMLGNSYPNPFNPSTTIYFDLHVAGVARLEIFNIRGQIIKTLANSFFDSGRHEYTWDGTDEKGQPVGSGLYFYRLLTDNYSETKRMMLMK